jgi:hypothetical protein
MQDHRKGTISTRGTLTITRELSLQIHSSAQPRSQPRAQLSSAGTRLYITSTSSFSSCSLFLVFSYVLAGTRNQARGCGQGLFCLGSGSGSGCQEPRLNYVHTYNAASARVVCTRYDNSRATLSEFSALSSERMICMMCVPSVDSRKYTSQNIKLIN